MFGRTKIATLVAEFLGAATLTSVVLAISKSGVGFSYFIACGVGLALALMVLIVGTVRDVSFNPAVTLGLWSARKIATFQALAAVAAQLLGGAAAWRLYEYLSDSTLRNIAGKEFDWRVLIAEALGAFVLSMGVAAAVYYNYSGVRLAATLGGALFLGVLLAAIGSNGLVNPAVALGLRSWNVAYTVGPVVGAILGVNLYALVFAPAGSFSVGPARAASVTPASTRRKASTTKKVAAKKKPVKRTTRKK